jgi:tRNA (guanine-N7-)-methyltransferase
VSLRRRKRLPADALAPFEWPPAGGAADFRASWGDPALAADADAPRPPELPPTPIDWATLFGNAHPVEIEVGFGKGLFLANSAAANPDTNYFGVEIIRKYQLAATNRLAAKNLTNARTCWGDARRVLGRHVPPASVAAVHVYFPDPWWKNRHKKRLLMTEEFVRLVHRVLVPGGVFHFATDVPEYFAWVRETMTTVPELPPIGPPPEPEPTHDMDYLTNFERRFRKQGKPIHRERYRKPG